MYEITPEIVIDEKEIKFGYIHASGPGGQNVNKVASAVQLRFDTASPALPLDVQLRLKEIAGKRINSRGVLVLESSRFRTQARNRIDVLDRFVDILRSAAEEPKTRIKTQPSKAAKLRRLYAKRHRGKVKRLRRKHQFGDE
jgi:ribosome-associated protein